MSHRYARPSESDPTRTRLRPAAALRAVLRSGYGLSDLRADLLSGLVVAMVAIPLGMALAIASGVSPEHGLYTVIIGGGVVALLGGSRFQVSGPTAAFVVILAPIAHRFGLGGLLVSGLMAGAILIALGVARMGKLIQFIPYPVTTGFTSGIATVIATLQLKDFLGLKIPEMPERFLEKVVVMSRALGTASLSEIAVGLATLALLLLWPRINRRIPAPLIALGAITVVTAWLKHQFPDFSIATIGTRFGGIPQSPPHFTLPWHYPGPDGQPFELSLEMLEALAPSAFAIAMLGAIESLLSAVVADGMAQTRHDPDAELVALGTGNLLCPFFGGIAATGAIARTATNIRFGARSPLSAAFHAIFTLLVVLLLAPLVSYLPMASLAALLLLVAYNMSELKHFAHIVRVAPRGDVAVLLLCFGLTVVFDMVVGVSAGVVMAAMLFMQRMAVVTSSQPVLDPKQGTLALLPEALPHDVLLYEIAGPLFFGASQNAAEAISGITDRVRVVIFALERVPVMDVTGLVALESAVLKLTRGQKQVLLCGAQPQPLALLERSAVLSPGEKVRLCASLPEALKIIKELPLSRNALSC